MLMSFDTTHNGDARPDVRFSIRFSKKHDGHQFANVGLGLGSNPHVGVWAHTLIPATLQPDRLVQVDQMGRPAINTVFNHGNDKVTFNGTQPHDQRGLFLASFVATLESFGYDSTAATNIGDILLPDVLTYDDSSSAGFLSGRKLTDDVIDIELNLVSKGAVTTDMVGAHSDYLRLPLSGHSPLGAR